MFVSDVRLTYGYYFNNRTANIIRFIKSLEYWERMHDFIVPLDIN